MFKILGNQKAFGLMVISFINLFFFMDNFNLAYANAPKRPPLRWEEVVKSKYIGLYATYLRQHPETEHKDEIKKFINDFLTTKISQEIKNGKELIKNSSFIPRAKKTYGWRIGDIFNLDRGHHIIGGVIWYSDPNNFLRIRLEGNGIKYLSGKGIGITEDKIYMFGF